MDLTGEGDDGGFPELQIPVRVTEGLWAVNR